MLQRQRGFSENDLRRKALLENELREVNAAVITGMAR